MSTQEFTIGNRIIRIIPNQIMPINATHKITTSVTVEIHHKGILRTKLMKSTKYDPLPILTIRAFLRMID